MRTTQVGFVSDISRYSGQSNGKNWTKTRFLFSVPEYSDREGKNVIRKFWINTFRYIPDLQNGPSMIVFDIYNRKTGRKNDQGYDIYELALDVVSAQHIELESGSVTERNIAYSDGEGAFDGEAFENDDIPF